METEARTDLLLVQLGAGGSQTAATLPAHSHDPRLPQRTASADPQAYRRSHWKGLTHTCPALLSDVEALAMFLIASRATDQLCGAPLQQEVQTNTP